METTRLFDLIDRRKALYPDRPVFGSKHNGQWIHHTIEEYEERANLISYALLHYGVRRGENVVLISSGRPEWNYVDMGVQQIGAVLLPVYPTISCEEYAFILNQSEARYLFVEGCKLLKKIESLRGELPKVEEVFVFDCAGAAPTLDDLLAVGAAHRCPEELARLKASIRPEDTATMIYTSGTTGTPKGVMLTHEGILLNVMGIKESPDKDWTRSLSWMPLCHIYERMMNYLYQYLGMETFYAESIAHVADNACEVNPYMMAAVPRFIEKMYDKIHRKGESLKGMRRKVFDWAVEIGFEYELKASNRTLWYRVRHCAADRLVYRNIRRSLGSNFRMLVSGGASIQPGLTRFFSAVGLDLYEGYGMTECAPLIAVTNAYAPEGRRAGSVGFALPGMEVRFDPSNHEILCRGKNVMKGYFKAPELTAEAIDSEGWLHTGDTGYMDKEGYMYLTGRTKNMFKTSMGKYVNPEVIEEKVKESPFVLDMMVVGEGQKFAAAIVAPDYEMLRDWCRRHGVKATTPEEMAADKEVLARYGRVMEKYNQHLGSHEQVKRFRLVTEPWTTENRLLTPTLKIRRQALAARYKEEIADLFA